MLCIQKGKAYMRRLANALLCLAILTTVSVTRANTVDPQFSVGDPATGTAVDSTIFSFTSNVHGGGILDFTNNTHQVWNSLDFFVILPSADTITCRSTLFAVCGSTSSASSNGQSLFDLGFESPVGNAGILPGESFVIDLNDPQSDSEGKGSWGPFKPFEGVANLPEPASSILVAAGCLLICALRLAYLRAAG
jgi:hypothetical protein